MRSVKGLLGIKPLPSVLTAARRARQKNVPEMGSDGRATLSRHARVLGRTQKQRPSPLGSQPNARHQVSYLGHRRLLFLRCANLTFECKCRAICQPQLNTTGTRRIGTGLRTSRSRFGGRQCRRRGHRTPPRKTSAWAYRATTRGSAGAASASAASASCTATARARGCRRAGAGWAWSTASPSGRRVPTPSRRPPRSPRGRRGSWAARRIRTMPRRTRRWEPSSLSRRSKTR